MIATECTILASIIGQRDDCYSAWVSTPIGVVNPLFFLSAAGSNLGAYSHQASCYGSSWRGLQSDASTPDDSRLITPETTPPQFLPTQRRDHGRFYIINLAEGSRMRSGVLDHEYSFSLEEAVTWLDTQVK